jgi:GNAT superfamily N-acetyltransferase
VPVTVLSAERAGDVATWDALVDSAPVPDVYYRPGYVQAAALPAGGPGVALVVDAEGSRVLVPLVLRTFDDLAFARGERGGDAITPYGYGGFLPLEGEVDIDLASLLEELRAWLTASGLVTAMLRLHPLLRQDAYPWDGAGAEYRRHGPSTAIELARWNDAARCIATLRKGHRADLGAARKQLEVRWGTEPPALAAFRALYDATMERLGAGPSYRFSPAYYEQLVAGLGDRLALALAYAGEVPVAGALFFADRDHAHYHLSATRPDHRVRGATTLIINEGAAWARARGCQRLQLGGGTTGSDALYAFKRGFGGEEYSYGFVTLVADAQRYAELVARRAATIPVPPRAGFFPAYRA